MIVINSLYVNLYKINKQEKKYFYVVVSMLLLSIVYNAIALMLKANTFGISIATLCAFITWFIFSNFDLKIIHVDCKNYFSLFIVTTSFLVITSMNNYYLGFVLYLLVLFGVVLLFYKNELSIIIKIIYKKFKIQKKITNDKNNI